MVAPPRLSVVALTLGALGLAVARGQEVQTPSRGSPARRQEVIVTAGSLEDAGDTQTVPVSMTELSAAQLQEGEMDTLSDLASQVPGLEVNGMLGEGTPLFSLRGISALDYGRAQRSPVAMYVDGVAEDNVVLAGVDLYDLDGVDVLRGPRGTLDELSATAGAIDILTHAPGFDDEGYLQIGTGDYGREEAEGALQGALADTLAARLAFTYTKVDGFVHDILPGQPDLEGVDQYGMRLGTVYRPNDSLTLLLRYSRSMQDPENYAVIDGCVTPPIPSGCVPGGVGFTGYYRTTTGTLVGQPLEADEIAQSFTERRRQDDQSVSLTADWTLSPALGLTSISSWSEGSLFNPENTDGAPIDVLKTISYEYVGEVAQDLRLTARSGDRFTSLTGVRYDHEDLFNTLEVQLLNDPTLNYYHDYRDCVASSFGADDGYAVGSLLNPGCRYASAYDELEESVAAYSDATYRIDRVIALEAGVRYEHDEAVQSNALAQLRGSDEVPIANIVPGTIVDGAYEPVEALPGSPDYAAIVDATTGQSLEDSVATERAGIDFTPTRDSLLYLSYATGFRPGAFNPEFYASAADLTRVEPEKVGTAEAGVKSTWLGGILQANGAVFHSEYQDQQSLDTLLTGQQLLINLPRTKIDGGELDLTVHPAPVLMLHAGVALLHSQIQEARIEGGLIDAAGNSLPFAPSAAASYAADWNAFSWRAAGLTLHLDGTYTTKQYFDLADTQSIAQGGYGLLNARGIVHAADNRWAVSAWCRNLFDKLYWTDATNLEALGFDYRHRGVPRMYGVDLTVRF